MSSNSDHSTTTVAIPQSTSSSSSSLALPAHHTCTHSNEDSAQEKEKEEFPSICSQCLGANPYVKMVRYHMDAECKMCNRVYTVFRWKRDRGSRYLRTMICPVCSAMKNVCQSCLTDLEFGLPAYVRDNVLNNVVTNRDANKSEFSKTMEADMVDRMMKEGGVNQHIVARGAARRSEQVLKFARSEPYTVQRLKRPLKAPEDTSIRTLYVGGIDHASREHAGSGKITQDDLRAVFQQYGLVKSIRMAPRQFCAFVTFAQRSDAETAADALHDNLTLRGLKLKIMWARPKAKPQQQQGGGGSHQPHQQSALAYQQQQQHLYQLQQQQQQQKAGAAVDPNVPQSPPFFVPSAGINLGPVPGSEDDTSQGGAAMYASLMSAKKNKKK